MSDIFRPDLCIIGAGAGGLAAAIEARRLGASVMLVEKTRMGGESLNAGAVPGRALAAAAARAHAMRTAPAFGIAADEPRINYRRVHDRVQGVIEDLAPERSLAHLAALGIETVSGEARFADRQTVMVGDTAIRARRIIVATGSRPVIPEIPGLADVPYFTSATIFDNTRKLSHLLVIGGGRVGIELAQAHRRLGSDVTLVDNADLLAGHDPELVEIALRRLREEGVTIHARTAVTAIRPRSQGIGVLVRSGEADEQALDVSHVLVATGRRPNLEALDPHKAALQRDGAGRLLLRQGLRTTNRRIYAIGDAAGGESYAHIATHQARLAVRHALLMAPIDAARAIAPRVLFIDPELAEIGLTEAQATAARRPVRVLRAAFAENDRARADGVPYGLVKLVVDTRSRVLGGGVVGAGAAELAAILALAVANRITLDGLAASLPPYPTLAEAIQRLARDAVEAETPGPLQARLASLIRRLP